MAQPPHVLLFPLPLQGPVNSMLKLAELLCLADLHVTFLVTDYIHARLQRHSSFRSRFDHYPNFQINTVSDGLPEDHPRGDRFIELFDSLRRETQPLFKEMLISSESESRRRVSCIVADGILGFTFDVGNELGIPVFYVRTISACCLWVFFCLPKLIQAGEIPFNDDMDELIKSVPGMERFLRRRDLPSFCRSGNVTDPNIRLYRTECDELPRAHGLILNTFEELEGPILSEIRSLCPNIYTIGPLHTHLKAKLAARGSLQPTFSNSLWEEDRTCVAWLDAQPSKSVIYVSFGSLVNVTNEQYMEFWHGLVSSGQRFLWVIRPDSILNKDSGSRIPDDLSKGTKERGYIVDWAPQEEVLAHPSVGGFLTHSGWNSTLESVFEGVPMICWPYFVDQQVNSRFVGNVWDLGLDMKDTCDRNVVEKMVRDLMEVRKGEFLQRADEMAKSAKRCLVEGGSSYISFERLIKDIGNP
ncbi:7-deoxyloganetic acid glucosyl transferase-like isoform X2 [Henckelia pumila]|uniref:7-deoxyloganetic acid glucosyl transferase-like isoform X2 n=1 Tax=Henckelia pumila TaxID=405737 RepID=UPI003C6E1459